MNIYSIIMVLLLLGSPALAADNGFTLLSSMFQQGQQIPGQYTADGANISPPLSWTKPPANTRSFALICEDPDAPAGTWTHWLMYDIPSSKNTLEQGIAVQTTLTDGTKQGINSSKHNGYDGPSPPPGKPHRYFFKLYALDRLSGFPAGIDSNKLQAFVQTHKLAKAELMGTYGR